MHSRKRKRKEDIGVEKNGNRSVHNNVADRFGSITSTTIGSGPEREPQTVPVPLPTTCKPRSKSLSRTTAWRMDKILAASYAETEQFTSEVEDNTENSSALSNLLMGDFDGELGAQSLSVTPRTSAWRLSKSLTAAANNVVETFDASEHEATLAYDSIEGQSDEPEFGRPPALQESNSTAYDTEITALFDEVGGTCFDGLPDPVTLSVNIDGATHNIPTAQRRPVFSSHHMAELKLPSNEEIVHIEDSTCNNPDVQERILFDSQHMAELNLHSHGTIDGECFIEEDTECFEEDLSGDWADTEEVWYDCQDTQGNISQTGESFDNVQNAKKEEATPLYEGCPINLGQSMLIILLFATRHTLTGAALSDLLTLISMHCLSPNLCRTSLFLFNKFFASLKSPVKFHRYCSFCMFLLDSQHSNCPVCQKQVTKQGTSFFIEIPIAQQIVTLMQKNGFYDDIQHRFHRKKKRRGNIEDIYDGGQYKHHMQPGGFLDNKNNLSFMWYTDGCPIFKSSKYSLWPLYFLVNELPYRKRLLKENLIYAGLWFGEKPAMGSFFMPFHHSLKQLKDTGVDVHVPGLGDPIVVKAMVLCGTCDLPARSMVMNSIQFNGAYGCCHCLQKGESAKSGRGSTWTYPFKESNPKGPKRTHEGVEDDARKAYNEKKTVNGIKGPTFLSFTGCDLVNGVAIDYMHTVLLGVVRKLLHLWFDSSHHKEPFSITKRVQEVDARLSLIKPPRCITRIPRSIKEHLAYWKASECRSWLFYYGVPVLSGILDDIYLSHFALLVEAIFILNGESITSDQLQYCERLLYHFCCTMSVLYGERYMTAVVHHLVHLTDVVRQLGPLWVYSCFALEDANGTLLSFVKGTQKPELQILSSLQIMLRIPHLSNMVSEDSLIRGFVRELTIRKHLPKKTTSIGSNYKLVGTMKEYVPSSSVADEVAKVLGYPPQRCWKFLRLQQGDSLFHSKEYTFTSKRNSYTVKYHHGGVAMFGEVQFYLKCVQECTCISTCLCVGTYVAYVLNMEKLPIHLVQDDVTHNRLGHISVVGLPHRKDIVHIAHLSSVCVVMRFPQDGDRAFIAEMPNSLESD